MTDEQYRETVFAIEDEHALELRKLLIRKANGNKTYERVPELIHHTPEARLLVQEHDAKQEALVTRFYNAMEQHEFAT